MTLVLPILQDIVSRGRPGGVETLFYTSAHNYELALMLRSTFIFVSSVRYTRKKVLIIITNYMRERDVDLEFLKPTQLALSTSECFVFKESQRIYSADL